MIGKLVPIHTTLLRDDVKMNRRRIMKLKSSPTNSNNRGFKFFYYLFYYFNFKF